MEHESPFSQMMGLVGLKSLQSPAGEVFLLRARTEGEYSWCRTMCLGKMDLEPSPYNSE